MGYVDACVHKWMQVGVIRCKWESVDESECKLGKLAASGGKWMQVAVS